MMTLISLDLFLDDDPTCVNGGNCSHNVGGVFIQNNTGDWFADTQVCPDGGPCSFIQVTVSDTAIATLVSVPEPTTLALLSLGLVGLGFTRRRMKV
jgi:hypothetical protein